MQSVVDFGKKGVIFCYEFCNSGLETDFFGLELFFFSARVWHFLVTSVYVWQQLDALCQELGFFHTGLGSVGNRWAFLAIMLFSRIGHFSKNWVFFGKI